MSTEQQSRTRWMALLALPVLCCVGHAVLLALGVGSLAAVTGTVTGRVMLVAAGLVLAVVAGAMVLHRARQR